MHFETQVHFRREGNHHLEVTITPHMDKEQHIEYLVFTEIDIATRKRAETDIYALIDATLQLVWTG